MKFTTLSAAEIERRRLASIAVMAERSRTEFERWYQARCDRFYWSHGRCCAGCDHWSSEAGDIGECTSAPPVSGFDVVRSLGIDWCTYTPPPGQPFTRHDHVCGAFKDEFDWSSLPAEYLVSIGCPPQADRSPKGRDAGSVHESGGPEGMRQTTAGLIENAFGGGR